MRPHPNKRRAEKVGGIVTLYVNADFLAGGKANLRSAEKSTKTRHAFGRLVCPE